MAHPSDLDIWPVPFDSRGELDWADPTTSRRLLREHLDSRHDSASRRPALIARHLRRLNRLLPNPPARILDAACGPGLYAVPLAEHGFTVTGFDVGPAVVAHARQHAQMRGVGDACRFDVLDLTAIELEPDHDAVILIYHVLEAFPRDRQPEVLRRLRSGLVRGGRLIVEMRLHADHPDGRLSSWEVVEWSLLADRRHLLLSDSVYDATARTYVLRETAVFDDGTTAIQQTTSELTPLQRIPALFKRGGFTVQKVYEGWTTHAADAHSATALVVAIAS